MVGGEDNDGVLVFLTSFRWEKRKPSKKSSLGSAGLEPETFWENVITRYAHGKQYAPSFCMKLMSFSWEMLKIIYMRLCTQSGKFQAQVVRAVHLTAM
jgi:hypothetical protein